ncbi:ATP-binding protein [Nocardioides sambongensis]|uniref:ATP-binding protein n=1 Tax=Nocardioides sambongensis TaxID=2589074 RepID=UPI00112B8891|nr:AAA family ATPase [Nocardioides sambongensis]
MAVRIRLASALAIDLDEGAVRGQALGSRKARTLIALLAAGRGAPIGLDRIVEVLWPEAAPVDPAANVATLVSRARRRLGPGVLVGGAGAYGLDPDGGWTLDLDEAERLLAEAAGREAAGEPLLAATAARAALDLLGDQPALVDEEDAAWVQAVRREADELRRAARHRLTAALLPLETGQAAAVAADAVAADPLDERAVRDLIRALVADGRPSAALAAHDDLLRRLREELGTLPDQETAALHAAVLREQALTPESTGRAHPTGPALVGRGDELAVLERAWASLADAEAGRLVLVRGEAGIGKTRLLEAAVALARDTGGLVLGGRCHPVERSLFLQPFLDALRPVLTEVPAARLVGLVTGHEAAWTALVPDLAPLVGRGPALAIEAEHQRRRAYEAVLAALRRLSVDRPVLLTIDDLHDGGSATIDLLGYLARRLAGVSVLLVAAVRAEEDHVVTGLLDRATVLPVGPLPRSAVEALAARAGLTVHADQVMSRTAGHALSVVESLRALAHGDTGVPASLAAAVLARVERLEPPTRQVVETASVLRRRIDPVQVAALAETSEVAATRACEELVRVCLLLRSDHQYEFANDLIQVCVHDALPPALAVAYHRRAADLTAQQPEVMAEHAHAAGDDSRAALGWLLAGESTLRRAAVDDALELLDRALGVPAPASTRARAHLARSTAHDAQALYERVLADVDAALDLARADGDRRLEMAALRARGGDAAVALRLPPDELTAPLEAGLAIAAEIGDRRAEADFTGRMVILEAGRLHLATALAQAERGLARARAARSRDGVIRALDGLKTVLFHLGDADRLRTVVTELESLVRTSGDQWLLQWVVFESAFVAAAEDRWEDAHATVAEAAQINRRSGYGAYAGYLRAYDAWFARLAGDPDAARRVGREALAATSPALHPWWHATAAGLLAATLLETGDREEAESIARSGLAGADPRMPAAGGLVCRAVVAAATGSTDELVAARAGLDAVQCPAGGAWVIGADAYLLARHRLDDLSSAVAGSWASIRARADRL